MRKIIPLIALLLILIGCTKSQDALISENDDEQIVEVKETDDSMGEETTPPLELEETPPCSDDLSNQVIFRVINELDVPVENVTIDGKLKFGNLKPNEASCYLSAKMIDNSSLNDFWVYLRIDNTSYSTSCEILCGNEAGPYTVYEYTAGKFTMKLVSIYDYEGATCLRVKLEVEETPVFTEKQGG